MGIKWETRQEREKLLLLTINTGSDRYVNIENYQICDYAMSANDIISLEGQYETIKLICSERLEHKLNLEALSIKLGFIYTRHLICEHEKILRNLFFEGVDLTEFKTSLKINLFEQINKGSICSGVYIKFISREMGYGLFAEHDLLKDTFIGEYVGLLRPCKTHNLQDSISCAYILLYPSVNCEIDASEYGNIIRFCNHNESPNSVFECIAHHGLVHIACILSKDVAAGEEICVNYGQGYWKYRLPPTNIT